MLVAAERGHAYRGETMNRSPDAIEASYVACRRIARHSGSNFYASFVLLPRAKRRAMDVLYAFMRHTDDLADNPEPVLGRRNALDRWRAAVERTLLGDFSPAGNEDTPIRGPYYASQQAGKALLPALADVVRRFQVPPNHLRAVIDGVEMDLSKRRYETFAELQEYCERVASAVGLACIHVLGFRGREALEPARKCGIALQLTNILRDLREDVRQDRVYLPLEDLRQCGYSVEDLVAGVADERFARLMELEIDRAEQFYREGNQLAAWLEPDGRKVFGMMTTTYHSLLKKIARRPADVFLRRVRLSNFKKLQLTARWALLPSQAAAL